jgi:hypothetical protein
MTKTTKRSGSEDEKADDDVVASLCAELTALLRAERAAGNAVVETARDYPLAVNVWMRRFRARPDKLPAHVRFEEINDPHYWFAEYQCQKHRHFLGCRF